MRLQICASVVFLTAGSLAAQTPPVPALYQDVYSTLTTQIAAFDATVNSGWNGSKYPYLDAPQLSTANSDQYTSLLGASYYTRTVTTQLQEMQALGANAVTIHLNFPIFYQPFYTYSGNPAQYQQFVSFYQQLFQDIRARGMKIVVEASLGLPLTGNQASVFQAYAKTLSWTDYVAGRAANALAVAQLLSPDYMTVLTESNSEASVSGQTNLNTVAGVIQLVQQVLTTLQTAGVQNVKVGAGVGTWTTNYMQYVTALAALQMDFVDMHIYPINKTYFTNALTAADTIHAAGKEVGMSECWDWKIRDSEVGKVGYAVIEGRDPFSFWQPIDASFLQAVVNFANYKQLAFLSPFSVHYFFAYLDYSVYGLLAEATILRDSDSAATNAVLVGAFTPTGLAWETDNIPADTTLPSTPAPPTAPVIGTTGFNLVWTPDSDNVGVSAYNLYRDGTLLSTTSLLGYNDKGLVSGETYSYTLSATDAAGNVSAMSAPLVIETIDITPPSVPTNLKVTAVTSGTVSLSWTPSTGIGGVGGYRILEGTSPTSLSIHANVSGPPYTATVRASTTYYFEVESYNPRGVTSGPSNQVTATTPAR